MLFDSYSHYLKRFSMGTREDEYDYLFKGIDTKLFMWLCIRIDMCLVLVLLCCV